VRVVDLSDEETVAILTESFTDSLADLNDKHRQLTVLNRLQTVLASSSPQRYIYETVEGCEKLEVIRTGNQLRILCLLKMGVPDGNEEYNILYCFYVDPHTYNPDRLQRLDDVSEQKLDEINSLDSVPAVDAYLDRYDAFTESDIQDRIDRA
jgi:hypothetical protein